MLARTTAVAVSLFRYFPDEAIDYDRQVIVAIIPTVLDETSLLLLVYIIVAVRVVRFFPMYLYM